MYLPKVILLLFVNKIIGLVTAGPQRCSICSKIQGSTVWKLRGNLILLEIRIGVYQPSFFLVLASGHTKIANAEQLWQT